MKFKNHLLITLLLLIVTVNAQETKEAFKPSGKPLFTIFSNFYADFTKDASQKTAFQLQRVYFGYTYNFTEKISANVTLDVGNNNEGSAYTAFLKKAHIDWKVDLKVKLSIGLIGMKQFNDQEKFWGYRYIFHSFQDRNRFGASADLGINAEFQITENLKGNVLVVNGEGFRNLQDEDGNQRYGANLVYSKNGFTAKVYADTQNAKNIDAYLTYAFFAGYKTDNWRIGGEYNVLNNGTRFSIPAQDHDLDGLSFYGTYIISDKIEVFGRFDQLNSNKLSGDFQKWNQSKNGNQIIAGLQYTVTKGIKFALNYQGYNFDNNAINNKSLVYINALYKL